MTELTPSNPIHDFWFNKNAKDIYIICSRVAKPPKDAYKYSNDYAYFDNFGDKDSLLTVFGILARSYPYSTIQCYYAEDFTEKIRDWQQKNIVIIGGPNSRNPVCQTFAYEALIKKYNDCNSTRRLIYPPKTASMLKPEESRFYKREVICSGCPKIHECPRLALCLKENGYPTLILPEVWEEIIVASSELDVSQIDPTRKVIKISNTNKVAISGYVKKDIGFFASFINPYDKNKENRIVMIGGLFTLGVFGTCQVMSPTNKRAIEIYNSLYYEFIGKASHEFVTYFDIDISPQRDTSCNSFDINRLISFAATKDDEEIANVFISYRRDQARSTAHELYTLLKKCSDRKVYPFIDFSDEESGFSPGVNYVIETQKKIKEADIFIAIISKESFLTGANKHAGDFWDEWFWAITLGKIIIPIECNGVRYADELNNIKDEIIIRFGQSRYHDLSHTAAVPLNNKNIINTILQKLKGHYSV